MPWCRLCLDTVYCGGRNLYLSRQAELARQNFVFFPVCVEAETARERRLCGVFPLCSEVDLSWNVLYARQPWPPWTGLWCLFYCVVCGAGRMLETWKVKLKYNYIFAESKWGSTIVVQQAKYNVQNMLWNVSIASFSTPLSSQKFSELSDPD